MLNMSNMQSLSIEIEPSFREVQRVLQLASGAVGKSMILI